MLKLSNNIANLHILILLALYRGENYFLSRRVIIELVPVELLLAMVRLYYLSLVFFPLLHQIYINNSYTADIVVNTKECDVQEEVIPVSWGSMCGWREFLKMSKLTNTLKCELQCTSTDKHDLDTGKTKKRKRTDPESGWSREIFPKEVKFLKDSKQEGANQAKKV